MSFTRYEIRTYYRSPEGVLDFTYTPFDNNIQDVIEYILNHPELQNSEDDYVCRVELYSEYDNCKRLATTKEYWQLHERGIL